MRKLILWNLVTLDGYFEGPKSWDIDWHEDVFDEELEAFSLEQGRAAGALLFGRVTYEGMAAYWPSQEGEIAEFMNRLPKFVFSRTLEEAEWANTTLVKENAAEVVAELKEQSGKDLFLFGSADFASTLMQHDLIDEYRLCVTPLVLGDGNPLFKPQPERLRFELLEARPLKSGSVLLRYQPEVASGPKAGPGGDRDD